MLNLYNDLQRGILVVGEQNPRAFVPFPDIYTGENLALTIYGLQPSGNADTPYTVETVTAATVSLSTITSGVPTLVASSSTWTTSGQQLTGALSIPPVAFPTGQQYLQAILASDLTLSDGTSTHIETPCVLRNPAFPITPPGGTNYPTAAQLVTINAETDALTQPTASEFYAANPPPGGGGAVSSVNGQTGAVTGAQAVAGAAIAPSSLATPTISSPTGDDLNISAASGKNMVLTANEFFFNGAVYGNYFLSVFGAGRWGVGLGANSSDINAGGVLSSSQFVSPSGLDLTASADSTTAFLVAVAAINALPTGGAILLPAGTIKLTTGSITFTKPVRILGAGAGSIDNSTGGTTLQTGGTVLVTSGNGDLLKFTAPGCTVESVMIINTASASYSSPTTAPTSGTGLLFNNGDAARVVDVQITGFWDDIHFVNGIGWNVHACSIYGAFHTGLTIEDQTVHDGGDQSISDCYFGNSTQAIAVFVLSGGGPRVANCKFNGWINHVSIAPPDGVSTSDFFLTGCSLENCSGTSITCQQSGTTGTWNNVQIKDCQFAVMGNAIFLGPGINNSVIAGNDIDVTGLAVHIGGGTGNIMLPNVISGGGTSNVSLSVSNTATNVDIAKQKYRASGDPISVNIADSTAQYGVGARIDYGETKPLPTTVNTTAQTIATLTPAAFSGALVTVVVNGIVQGAGAFAVRAQRMIEYAGSTAAITTVGSDVSAGAGAAYPVLTFVAGSSGTVLIKIASTSDTDTLSGSASVTVDGTLSAYLH